MRLSVVVTAVCMSIVGLAVADDVRAAIRKQTSIPAEGLVPALKQLARERNLQVVFQTEIVGAAQTHGAVGEFTTQEALTQLLEGTDLVYRFLDDKTITILPATSTERAGSAAGQTASPTSSNTQNEPANSGAFLLAQAASGSTAGAASVGQSTAQQVSAPIQEVIVTAQKRSERLIDVPISVVAVSAEELRERQVTDIDDLSLAVPDLHLQSTGTTRRILLRGISNLTGTSPQIGLYLDEADVGGGPAFQLDLRPYDLDRVEVLRGPQGTLYGEGSVGGTVRFITKDPQLEKFTAEGDVSALFTQDGAPSQRLVSVLNVPLVTNELGLRIAGNFDHEGGWIDQPAANARDINDQNLADVRLKTLWHPTSQFAASAMLIIHRDRGPYNAGEDANGKYTQTFNLMTSPGVKDDYDVYNLTFSYDFGFAALMSTATYLDHNQVSTNLGQTYQFTPPGTPRFDYYDPYSTQSAYEANEEVRFTSRGSGPWQWTVGEYYRHASFDSDFPGSYFGLPGPPGTPLQFPFASASDNLFKSWAAFGDTSYKLTERFTLGAGVRYFHDDQDYATSPPIPPITQNAQFHSTSPRVYAQYKVSDEVSTYASAAKGFRSGGFNLLNQPTFGPETVWTYELGTKWSGRGGDFTGDAALFSSNYDSYQVNGIVLLPQPTDITSNAGKARVDGIEEDLSWRVLPQWTLGLSGDYIKSRFVEINAQSSPYNVGDPLDGFPKYQIGATVERTFAWDGRRGFARLDYEMQGPMTYRDRNLAGPTPWYFDQSDTIHMLNFHWRVQWSDSFALGLFGENLLNDRGYTTQGRIEDSAPRARPRTYGIEFSFSAE